MTLIQPKILNYNLRMIYFYYNELCFQKEMLVPLANGGLKKTNETQISFQPLLQCRQTTYNHVARICLLKVCQRVFRHSLNADTPFVVQFASPIIW
jgi:hypothetical protein